MKIPPTYCSCLRAFAPALLFAWTIFLFGPPVAASSSCCQISAHMSERQISGVVVWRSVPISLPLTGSLIYSFRALTSLWNHVVWLFSCLLAVSPSTMCVLWKAGALSFSPNTQNIVDAKKVLNEWMSEWMKCTRSLTGSCSIVIENLDSRFPDANPHFPCTGFIFRQGT